MIKYTAKIENGIVTQVIAGSVNWASGKLGGTWIDATDQRVGIGFTYTESDGFRPPQPYASWSWNGEQWVAPVQMPDGDYMWNEEKGKWELYE